MAYRLQADADEPGEPVTRIRPRALMVPPGLPRLHVPRPVRAGRATHGSTAAPGPARRRSTRVEVSTDGGATWPDADLEPPPGRVGLVPLAPPVGRAEPGGTSWLARATDAAGDPAGRPAVEPQGLANNLVQRVEVICAE